MRRLESFILFSSVNVAEHILELGGILNGETCLVQIRKRRSQARKYQGRSSYAALVGHKHTFIIHVIQFNSLLNYKVVTRSSKIISEPVCLNFLKHWFAFCQCCKQDNNYRSSAFNCQLHSCLLPLDWNWNLNRMKLKCFLSTRV